MGSIGGTLLAARATASRRRAAFHPSKAYRSIWGLTDWHTQRHLALEKPSGLPVSQLRRGRRVMCRDLCCAMDGYGRGIEMSVFQSPDLARIHPAMTIDD